MKMPMVIGLVVSLGPLLAAESGPSVDLINGNVFVTIGDGKPRQLTSSGKDYDPSLSPDGKLVVFARALGESMDCFEGQPKGLYQHSEVWMVGVDGKGLRRLFAGEIDEGEFRQAACLHFTPPR
jgi:hypothetical protein